MKLRDYQKLAVDTLRALFNRGLKSLLLVIPTGGGKTVVFTTIAKGAISNGKTVMIVCDRKELISQANDNLKRLGLTPTIIAPGYPQYLNNCYLASVDSLRRRDLPEVDIMIIDEAHKQTFDKLIQRYKDEGQSPLIIGATATPLRTGGQTSLHEYYDQIVEPTTTDQLLNAGHLVPCRTFAAKMDLSAVKLTGGDYNNAALYNEFNKAKLYAGVIDQYEKFAAGKKTLIFNVNVEHSINTVEAFRSAGYKAEHLDGKTSRDRRVYLLESFHRGEFDILSNCSVLTTGYDEPSIEAIIMNRATKSLPLYLQMAGRGSRLYPGKKDFTLIDMGANCYEHGLWSDPRTWEIKKKKKSNSGVAPVKLCPSCEAMNPSSAKFCHDCKHIFPIQKKELLKAEFVEVKATRGLSVEMDFKNATLEQLKEYGKKQNYKTGWAHVQFKNQNRGLK
tara:strand:+ start:4505 stop:5845 length:1341 start_codon:yes stop_codon:yes gene_type:complete